MSLFGLLIFSLAWIAGVYLVNCLLAREFKRIEVKPLLLYVTTIAMIGTFGELFWDGLYERAFGIPLWEYYVYPIHDAHTSYFAAVLWGLYGFHLYLLYDTIRKRYKKATKYLALIFALEALMIEALVSLTYLAATGDWLYYYLPGDMWHVTTIQNFPLYIMAGYVIVGTLKRFEASPWFFVIMNGALISVVLLLA